MKQQIKLHCLSKIISFFLLGNASSFIAIGSRKVNINESCHKWKRIPSSSTPLLTRSSTSIRRDRPLIFSTTSTKNTRISSALVLALVDPTPYGNEEEETDEEDYSQKLSAAVGNLFQLSRGAATATLNDNIITPSEAVTSENLDGFNIPQKKSYSPTELKELLGTLAPDAQDSFDYSSFPFELAPVLDPETYSSITGTTVFPSYYGPKSSFTYDDGDDDDEEVKEVYYNYGANMDPEELHRLIMKQEPGYETQSEEFKEALFFSQMQNRTIYSQQAAKARRSTEWNARQQRAINELEREMEKFEHELEEKELRKLEEKQGQNKTTIVDGPQISSMNDKGDNNHKIPNDLGSSPSRPIQGQQQQLRGGTTSTPPETAAESFQNKRQQQRIEYYRTEMNRYKVKAEKSEKEVRRLLAVIRNLEEALSVALSSGDTEPSMGIVEEKEIDEELPFGWVRVEDPDVREDIYYMNEETGEISYEIPPLLQ